METELPRVSQLPFYIVIMQFSSEKLMALKENLVILVIKYR